MIVKFNSIKQVIDKLLDDEVFYALEGTSVNKKSKIYRILRDITYDNDLLLSNFQYLKTHNFFDSEDEEEEFKNFDETLQIFYYVVYKKYTQV